MQSQLRRTFTRPQRLKPCAQLTRGNFPRRTYTTQKTVQAARDRAAVGVFTPKAAALFVAIGTGLFFYFKSEKAKLEEKKRQARAPAAYGRPDVGGPFNLISQDGKPFSDQDLLGSYSLVYFGFTNCPDICPDELDKMGKAVDAVEKSQPVSSSFRLVKPIFVSVDPARDSIEQVRRYALDFHPRLIALTGSYASVKSMCKVYRVYFSSPPPKEGNDKGTIAADDDYLVDHSIYFYLMDPDGRFVQAFGKNSTAEDVSQRVEEEIAKWERGERGPPSDP